MSPQLFMESWRAINDFSISSKALKFLSTYYIGLSKVGYLSTVGWLFRNLIDSAVKNMMLTGSPSEFPTMAHHMLETWKLYMKYNEVQKAARKLCSTVSPAEFHRAVADLYKNTPNQPMTKDMFYLFNNALEQGATAGMTAVEKAAIDLVYKNKKAHENGAQKLMNALYNNGWSQFIMKENTVIEQVMRLSGYTWALKNGANTDQAMHAVLKAHFDYSTKSIPMMYAEYFIPFLSFTTNNLVYWLDAVEKHGWLANLYRDISTPIWNFDEYDTTELNKNRSLQYHILAGNIRMKDNLVIKINPSISDAVRMATDPMEWYQRVTPIFRLPAQTFLDLALTGKSSVWTDPIRTLAENMPLIGPTFQRYWYDDEAYKQGSALKGYARVTDWAKILPVTVPSIFGGTQRNYYFGYTKDGTVYMTHSEETLKEKVAKGAIAITPGHGDLPTKKPYKKYIRKAYVRKTYAKKMYFKKPKKAKKIYSKKIYTKKTYLPVNYSYTVQTRILASVRNSQMKMPGARRNISHVAPSLYRKIYSSTGKDIFKVRMIPMTQAYLISRLRQDWSYFRR